LSAACESDGGDVDHICGSLCDATGCATNTAQCFFNQSEDKCEARESLMSTHKTNPTDYKMWMIIFASLLGLALLSVCLTKYIMWQSDYGNSQYYEIDLDDVHQRQVV